MGKRTAEEIEAEEKAARKAAKKAKKAAAAAAEEEVDEEAAAAAALAEKKAAKKAKKAAAAAAVEAEPTEEEAAAARKAAKKAKKAAAAAAAEEEAAPAPKKSPKLEPKKSPKLEAAKAPAAPAAEEDEEFKDNTYKCCDCNEDWIDTAGEQQFRWDKGFAETPKRCKDCRWAKKVRMEGGDPTAKGKGKKGKSGGGDVNTVFVRGLPFSVTEEALNKDFGECGEVANLRMPLNDEGSPRGFAFITYSDKEGMDKAMAFNETDYCGRTIFVTDAAIKPEGKGKKGKAPSESFAKSTGAMVESTGTKVAFADSDDE